MLRLSKALMVSHLRGLHRAAKTVLRVRGEFKAGPNGRPDTAGMPYGLGELYSNSIDEELNRTAEVLLSMDDR